MRTPRYSPVAGKRREAERGFSGTALTGLLPAAAAAAAAAAGQAEAGAEAGAEAVGGKARGGKDGIDMDAELAAAAAAAAEEKDGRGGGGCDSGGNEAQMEG